MMLKRIATVVIVMMIATASALFLINTKEGPTSENDLAELNPDALLANHKPEEDKAIIDYKNFEVKPYINDPSSFSYDSSEFEVAVPEGYETGSIAGKNNNLYYLLIKPIPMGQRALATTIFHVDTETGDTQQMLHFEDKGHWVNELVAADGLLFWVLYTEEGQRIERYDIEKGTLTTVKEFPPESHWTILSGGEEYLTWYEHSEENVSLYVYDIEEKQLFLVSNQIARQMPFVRAHVNNGITAFSEDRNGDLYLCVYDLHEQAYLKELRTTDDSRFIISLQANSDYMTWQDSGYNSTLYAYDLANNRLICVVKPEDNIDIFSHHLLKGMVIINNSRNNQIIGRLLSSGKEVVMSKTPESHSYSNRYFLGNVYDEQTFIADGYVDNHQFILMIKLE